MNKLVRLGRRRTKGKNLGEWNDVQKQMLEEFMGCLIDSISSGDYADILLSDGENCLIEVDHLVHSINVCRLCSIRRSVDSLRSSRPRC